MGCCGIFKIGSGWLWITVQFFALVVGGCGSLCYFSGQCWVVVGRSGIFRLVVGGSVWL